MQDKVSSLNKKNQTELDQLEGKLSGFETISEEFTDRGNNVLFTETEVKLYEVSPCTFPAYPQTEIHARKTDAEQSKTKLFAQRKAEIKNKLEGIKC